MLNKEWPVNAYSKFWKHWLSILKSMSACPVEISGDLDNLVAVLKVVCKAPKWREKFPTISGLCYSIWTCLPFVLIIKTLHKSWHTLVFGKHCVRSDAAFLCFPSAWPTVILDLIIRGKRKREQHTWTRQAELGWTAGSVSSSLLSSEWNSEWRDTQRNLGLFPYPIKA